VRRRRFCASGRQQSERTATLFGMTPCEHCSQPAQPYTIRFIDAAERRERNQLRNLCPGHAEQYVLLQERWGGVLLSIEPAF